MDLYLDKLPELDKEFRKEAAFGARLGETVENWGQELQSELYKQLPYLSDYEVNVNLDRVDQQRGFGFGYADIANKTERPEAEHGEMGLPHIRVPLIVQERSVKPFSTFLDGDRVLPLTEERVRETLFNPGTFDISAAHPPRDPSLVEPLMPPTRSGAGMGGEYKTASVQKVAYNFADARKYEAARQAAMKAAAKKAPGVVKPMEFRGINGPRPSGGADSGALLREFGERNASVRTDLLHAIAPTIREKDADSFIDRLEKNATIRAGLRRAGVVEGLIEVFDYVKRASVDDRLSYIAESIEPTVVTIHKFPGGDFLIKSANVNALDPNAMKGQVVPGQEAAQAIGPQNAQAMMPGQTATVVANPVQAQDPEEGLPRAKPIDEFGEYKVFDSMGNVLFGWVFPETLAWDGSFSPQPISLFTNGSAFATQDSVAGELVGKGTNLPVDRPLGEGVFYTAPINVKSMMAGPDGLPKMICTDLFGNQLQISHTDGLSQPQRISDVEYAIPRTWKFMRLNNQTQLQGSGQAPMGQPAPAPGQGGMSDAPAPGGGAPAPQASPGGRPGGAPAKPGASAKKPVKKDEKKDAKKPEPKKDDKPTVQVNVDAKAKKEKTSATLWFNGGYNIAGGCGLDKLSADARFDMSPVDAEFMLGLLGVDGLDAKQKVAEARRKGSVKLAGLKTITLLSERYAESVKTASAIMREIPDLRRDLVKEAATLQDQSTVNNVLALNFLNPENLSTFVDYIPELEETSEKLSEMLLMNYLGMNELPEGAVERAMRNVEDVLVSLKGLAAAGPQQEE
jgi:hypothetical protein